MRKKIHISTARKITLLITAVLVALIFFIAWRRSVITGRLSDQTEADRWGTEETRCGQVSVYFNQSSQVKRDNIREFDYNINKSMTNEGLQPIGALPEDDNTTWGSCFSAVGTLNVAYNKRSVDVLAYGVGGDFFQFHPLPLASGSYFDGNAVMKDYVLLDEDLAWQLFGSSDIVGKEVTIEGIPHRICGVVKKDKSKYAKYAGVSGAMIFTSFETLGTYGKIDSTAISAAKASDTDDKDKSKNDKSDDKAEEKYGASSDIAEDAGGIICYEVVMPSPVEGFAPSFVQRVLNLDTENVEIVNNTDRFTNRNLLKIIASFGIRSMQMKALIYPYWENVARGYEDVCAILLLIQICLGITAAILVIVMIVRSYMHKSWTIESVAKGIGDWKYDLESRIKASHSKWKHF